MKTIKIMSDGNQAKVGMIIFDNRDGSIGVITHIKSGFIELLRRNNGVWGTSIASDDFLYKPIVGIKFNPLIEETKYNFCLLQYASKATPEQKKLYWLELEKQTIQFRPEFEVKLKELGIRDQFVNNLFDPKWDQIHTEQNIKKYYKEKCLTTDSWRIFIKYAFQWHNTPEKEDYWKEITNK